MLTLFRTIKDYFLWRPRGTRADNAESGESGNSGISCDPNWDITISFSCGGWFHIYYFGVAHALVKSGVLQRWEREGKRVRFCGSSVGALAATALASGQYDFESMRETVVEAAQRSRSSVWNVFGLRRFFKRAIDRFSANLTVLERDDHLRHRVGGGRLEVSVTILPRLQAKLLRDFTNYADLREALLASCCIVPFIHMPFKMRRTGEWVVDGAVANFTPRITEPGCISISPMYFQDASVRPHIFVPMWWALWPPQEERYRNLFWMGYNDMIDYLTAEGWLDEATGESLLRPEMDFKILESYWDLAFTIFMECMMLIWVRPIGMVLIYTELLLSFALHTIRRIRAALLSITHLFRLAVWRTLSLQPQKAMRPTGAQRFKTQTRHSRDVRKAVTRTAQVTGSVRKVRSAHDSHRGLTPDPSSSSSSSSTPVHCMTPSKQLDRDTTRVV